MTDEEKDHLAVRIKHHGQCPLEKGHSNEWFVPGIIIGAVVVSFLFLALNAFSVFTTPDREREAIVRGLATRDPITREFKWLR